MMMIASFGGLCQRRRTTMTPCMIIMSLVVALQLLANLAIVAKGEEVVQKNLTSGGGGVEKEEEEVTTTTTTAAVPQRIISTTEQTTPSPVVRCHCNLPQCVTLGYMCKSTMGACFTKNTPTPTHAYSHARKIYHRGAFMHGCVEQLPSGRHTECMKKSSKFSKMMDSRSSIAVTHKSTKSKSDPDLTCCSQDMCNYDDVDLYIQVKGNYDSQTGGINRSDPIETLWFRAATIAVPIAGGFILIILVLLASRMLAKENKRQRMAQVIGERYLKAPLYPGGSTEPIPHLPLYYHPPLIRHTSLAQINIRCSYEEKPPNYRTPEAYTCNPEEMRPLNNTVHQDGHWDERDLESPLPS